MKHRIKSTCFIFIITAVLLISGHNTVFAVGADTGVKTDTLQLPPNPPQTPQTSTDPNDIKIKDFGNFPEPQDSGVKSDTPDLPSADRDAQKKMETVQEKYKSELKKDCLPLPDNLNVNDNISFGVMQVIDQYKGEPCEMMNEIKFHLDEKRGKNAGQIAWKMIDIFVIPDEGDALELLAKIFAKHAVPVAGIYSKLSDAKQFIELIDSEIETNRLHGQYLEAVNAYRSSKGWNMTQLKNETGSLYTDLKRKLKQVEKLESELYAECMKHYPSYQELAVYGPPVKPGTKIPNDAMIWSQYYEKIAPIERKYDYEIRSRLKEIAGIQLKIKFLEKYRKPLIEKPCKDMIAYLQKNCPQKTVETKPDTKPKEPDKKDQSAAPKTKEELFGCICRCTINPTVGVGATYDPKAWKNASPSCDDALNGPCVGFGYGCWRKHMESGGECFVQCTKDAGYDTQATAAEVKKIRRDAFNTVFDEAKRLINEYWFASPEPFVARAQRKTHQGDLDKAESRANQAKTIEPDLSSQVEQFMRDSSKRISYLPGSIIAEALDFQTSYKILDKAAAYDEKNDDAKGRRKTVETWQKDWTTIQDLVPKCYSLIKDSRPCECKKIFDDKITPADTSFTIPITFVNPLGGGSQGNDRVPVPEKEKMVRELKYAVDAKMRSDCKKVPGVDSALSQLNNFVQYRTYAGYAGINDEQAVKVAEDALKIKGLCDCDRSDIEKILKTAKDNVDKKKPKDEPKLTVTLSADKTTLNVNERTYVYVHVQNFKSTYSLQWGGHAQGLGDQGGKVPFVGASSPGTYTVSVFVKDAGGRSAGASIALTVIGGTASKPPVETTKHMKLDVSLMADKNMLKVGESAYIAAAVTGGKPPYNIKWGGALSGEGTTLLFKAQKSGSSIIYAEATDPAGNKGSASITISVEAEKTSAKEPSHDGTTKKAPSSKIGKSKIIVLGSKPETSSSPLKLKIPQGEQSQTLLFTYEHKSIETGKMIYLMEAPSATTFIIEPSNSGASIVRISNPAKWGEEKFFAVDIDKDVKPGKKFTVTAYYSGVPNPKWISNKYLDTGEDAEEYLKKNVKPATAVIEVIGGKLTPGKTGTGYNPTNDISYTPGEKTIDTAQIDSLAKTFQDTHINIKKTDGTQGPLTPQPPPPTDTATSKGSDSQNTAYTPPPYPPYAPPPDNKGTTTDWPIWATDKTGTKGSSNSHGTQKPPTNSGGQQGGSQGGSQGGGGSSTSSQPPPTTGTYVMAEITNKSKENVHIFTDGETFGPGNRFEPSKNPKKVKVKVPSNNKITFHAGRNGTVIASKAWYYDPDHPNSIPVVIFDENNPYGKLVIMKGLR